MNKNKLFSEIYQTIQSSQNFLMSLHPSPDADSLGSNLALYHYLKSINKSVTLINGDSAVPFNLSSLPGVDQITATPIQDINLADFDCYVALDSSDLGQITKKSTLVFPKTTKIIVMDHHFTNTKYGQINLIDIDSPATCQILAQFFIKEHCPISAPMALCLLVGIYTDSGGFKYSHVSHETFEIASKLAKIYPRFDEVIFQIENNNNASEIALTGQLLSHVEVTNHLAIASISYKEFNKMKINEDVSVNSSVANTLKSVLGWDIAVSMIENSYHQIRASFRTRDAQKYNVGLIAKSTGYGGGLVAAAGALFPHSIVKTKKIIKDTIAKLYPEVL